MSEVIDSRIVEMRFDNSQFESNVRESMKTIDNLKSSLDFEDSIKGLEKIKVDIDASGAVHGLQAISDAAGDCDLSQLSDSAESVKLSFSALEVVAVTALGKITSAAIDAGVMDKPSYKDFVEVFGCEYIVSKSKYSEFLNPKYNGYKNVGFYRSAKVKFLKLKTLDI